MKTKTKKNPFLRILITDPTAEKIIKLRDLFDPRERVQGISEHGYEFMDIHKRSRSAKTQEREKEKIEKMFDENGLRDMFVITPAIA